MLEGIVLGLFAAAILSCALTGHTVIWALIAGFFLFSGYGLFRGHGLKALGAMASKGVRTIMGIVIVMALIGMLTGSWRASGTIARLVTDAASFITPEWGLLAAFLLNGLLSTLTGTAFGTVAFSRASSWATGAPPSRRAPRSSPSSRRRTSTPT